ncbi:BRO family protein [Clostridioides difficile]|nr:BRO family protein [Clostridioides difficile]
MSKVEYLIFSMAQIEGSKIKTGGSSMLKILQEKNVKVMWSKNGEEVWFNANDVGEELGIVNIRDTLRNIDREYKKEI